MMQNRPGLSLFTKEAIAYREGMASRLVNRMWTLRAKRINEEEDRRKAERANNAAHGIYTENALVLADVISTEEDLNDDHLWGWPPGTSARKRKEREARNAELEREAAELLLQQQLYDEAHPEEAAARKAKERADYDARMKDYWAKQDKKKTRYRKATPEEERRGMRSFDLGYDKGGEISLDKQVAEDKRRLK
jgi:hypothetical protein